MQFKFDCRFNLQLENIIISADNEKEALEKLKKEIREDGIISIFDQYSECYETDCELDSETHEVFCADYIVSVYNIKYREEDFEDTSNLPTKLLLTITNVYKDDNLLVAIEDEIYSKTSYSAKSFDYKIIKKY